MAAGILALRDRLQDYGRGVPDAALGEALLGLLWTFPFPRRDLTPRGRLSLVGWRLAPFGAGIAAAAAAAAWPSLVRATASPDAPTRHGIAVELVADPRPSRNDDERAWVLDLLGRTPGVAAVHLAGAQRHPPVDWKWPMQVALFDDAESRRLRTELAARDLPTPISAARAPRPIELLVLGGTLPGALARVRDRAKLPRIHTVLVLGGIGRTSRPVRAAEELRRKARADAVCVVQVPGRREIEFLQAVFAGLAIDLDLDVALAAAARDHQLPPPIIVAAEGAFTDAHLTSRTPVAKSAPPASPPAPGDSSPGRALEEGARGFEGGAPGGALSPGKDAAERSAVDIPRSRDLDAPPPRAQPPQAQPPRPEPVPRHLQAELFAGEPPERVTTAPLAVGPHALEVWIGPPHDGALIARAHFPEQELPPSPDGHALTVVFAAPALGEPQVASLWLPPEGASRRAAFAFAVPAGLARLEARISVLHANRVLQTVVLAADVATGDPAPLALALEGVVRRDLDGLAGRRRFDAALIANRMSERRLVSVIAGDRASLVPTGASIDRLVGEVSQLLAAATNNPARYGAPDSEGTTELLADLARKGYLLREALLDMPRVRAELERAARIQIVIARPDETTLPLEICYDGVAPAVGATMCPAWRDALEAGACQATCPADRATVVCPVAFWGTHRVIERHAYAKIDAAQLAGNAYGLQQEPAVGRARLSIVGGSVCAAADAARAVDGAAVDRAFAEAGEAAGPSSEAKSWAEWRALIRGNPSILVLLAHSDMIKTNRALVIGAAETAMISDIGPALVGAGGGSGPIVLLLGCSTAIAEAAFQSFVAQFRAAGAAIVIGTLCEILGQHAAPIAGQILAEIQRVVARREPTPLGDLIPALRRRLLARGYPIAMAIAPYGDADWQI